MHVLYFHGLHSNCQWNLRLFCATYTSTIGGDIRTTSQKIAQVHLCWVYPTLVIHQYTSSLHRWVWLKKWCTKRPTNSILIIAKKPSTFRLKHFEPHNWIVDDSWRLQKNSLKSKLLSAKAPWWHCHLGGCQAPHHASGWGGSMAHIWKVDGFKADLDWVCINQQ